MTWDELLDHEAGLDELTVGGERTVEIVWENILFAPTKKIRHELIDFLAEQAKEGNINGLKPERSIWAGQLSKDKENKL